MNEPTQLVMGTPIWLVDWNHYDANGKKVIKRGRSEKPRVWRYTYLKDISVSEVGPSNSNDKTFAYQKTLMVLVDSNGEMELKNYRLDTAYRWSLVDPAIQATKVALTR
jgi:hypothetical protein